MAAKHAMETLKLIFSFSGRMNRSTYCVIATIASGLPTLPLYIFGRDVASYSAVQWLVATLVFIPCAWAMATANAQRLHDLDNSGWLQLVFVANFAITLAIVTALPILFRAQLLWPALAFNILALPIAAWAVWLMVEMICSSGTPEGNRFGAPKSFRELLSLPNTSRLSTLSAA